MDINTKAKIGKVLNYTKNIVLSLVMLFTELFLVPVVAVLIFLKIADPVVFRSIVALAPIPIDSWSTQIVVTFFAVAPFVAFIVWAVRDSKKFVAQGVNTSPFLWGIGMIFPLVLVVFPLYFVRRNITWAKEKQEIILANKQKNGLISWWSNTDFISENNKIIIKKAWSIIKWTWVVIVWSFAVLMIYSGIDFVETKKTDDQVAKIHATKLTMDDVMGVNLPPDPGAGANKTVAGIDANENGIRDDVELAIFKEYPDSAKTRAVLLQYALALQMEMVQPIVNKGTVTAVAEKTSGGYYCIGEITSREDLKKFIEVGDRLHGFIESRQLNTEAREKAKKDFYEGNLGSYELPSDCDIDLMSLPN